LTAAASTFTSQQLVEQAELYIKNNQFQQAIWSYQEAGNHTLAEKFKKELELRMKASSPASGFIDILIDKKLSFHKGYLSTGEHVIAKFYHIENEVLAYQVSEALGLYLIPATVDRIYKFNGREYRISVQIMVDDTIAGFEGPLRGAADFTIRPYPPEYKNLYLLDYLLSNGDRHEGNWLLLWRDRVVAIDHGFIFREPILLDIPDEYLPGDEVAQKLLHFKLKNTVGVSPANIRAFNQRRDIVIERLKVLKRLPRVSPYEKALETCINSLASINALL